MPDTAIDGFKRVSKLFRRLYGCDGRARIMLMTMLGELRQLSSVALQQAPATQRHALDDAFAKLTEENATGMDHPGEVQEQNVADASPMLAATMAELEAAREELRRSKERDVVRAQEWGGTAEAAHRAECCESLVRLLCKQQWELPHDERAFLLKKEGRNWKIEIPSFVDSRRSAIAAERVRAKRRTASVIAERKATSSPKFAKNTTKTL